MNEIICPSCEAASPEDALYCQRCGAPIRCKNCGAGILPDARACIKCGTMIPERELSGPQLTRSAGIAPGYNRITVHEKSQTYSFDADFLFSNEFGQQAGASEVIANLGGFGERAANSRPMTSRPTQPKVVVESIEQQSTQPQLTSGSDDTTGTMATPESVQDTSAMTPERALQTVFREQGGKLTLRVSDLKAATQKDYTFRLIHIYIYARMILFGESSVPRTDLYEVTDFARLVRENVVAYISQDTLIARDGDMLSFKLGGEEHAQKTLMEIVSSDTPGQWPPSAEVPQQSKPKKAVRHSSGSKPDEEDIARVVDHPETKALTADIPHSVISGMTITDKVIVSLYGLNKAGITGEVFYSMISTYLYHVFHTTVSADSIGSALRRLTSPTDKYVVHKKDVGYRITPSGSEYVEKTYRSNLGKNGVPIQTALVES